MTPVEEPHGIYPMLYSFFGANGQLDRGAIQAEVEAVVGQGRTRGCRGGAGVGGQQALDHRTPTTHGMGVGRCRRTHAGVRDCRREHY